MGYHGMKKGKKMPSIELDGHSETRFVLVDGKIVRAEAVPQVNMPTPASFEIDRRVRQ